MKKEHQSLLFNEILDVEGVRDSFYKSLNSDKNNAVKILIDIGFDKDEAIEALANNGRGSIFELITSIIKSIQQIFFDIFKRDNL